MRAKGCAVCSKYCADCKYVSILLGPSSPPTNIAANVTNSTSIEVMWDLVLAIHRNGDITGYVVVYGILGMDTADSVNVTASTLNVVLTGLEEYMKYDIRVSAYTAMGSGPFSQAVIVTTLEDGNMHSLHMYIMYTHL